MGAAVPKILKNFNLIVDGYGFAGLVDEVTLPSLMIKSEDHRGGGMDAPIMIDMGMEAMELKWTMAEHSISMFRQFGLRDGRGVGVIFRAVASDDRVVQAYVVEARGSYKELSPSAFKAGDKTPLSATLRLRYYKLTINGVTYLEFDLDNFKRVVDGNDVLAETRTILSI